MQGKQNCVCVPVSGVQFFCVRAPMLLGHNSTVVKCTFNSPIGCTEDKEDGRGFSFELHFYAAEQNWKSQSTEAAYSIPCIPLTRGALTPSASTPTPSLSVAPNLFHSVKKANSLLDPDYLD